MKIEEIKTLLEGISSLEWADFKRVFPAENHLIKLSFSDEEAVFSQDSGLAFNYARIDYSDGDNHFSWYYFVNSMRFIATSTFEVELTIDVLNSFDWGTWLTPRTFVKRALIKRYDSAGFPVLPLTGEDAQGDLVRTSDTLVETSPAYLVWMNCKTSDSAEGAGKPTCLYIPKKATQVKDGFNSDVAHAKNAYRFECSSETSFSVVDTADGTKKQLTLPAGNYLFGYATRVLGDHAYNYGYVFDEQGNVKITNGHVGTASTLNIMAVHAIGSFSLFVEPWTIALGTDLKPTFTKTGAMTPVRSDPFSALERTASDLAKIVEIPYPARGANLVYEYDAEGHLFGRFVQLENSISWERIFSLNKLRGTLKTTLSDTREDALAHDPKLFSKQFLYYKWVYDSYSDSIGVDDFTSGDFRVKLTMTPSSSMSSSLIFRSTPLTGEWNDIREDFPHLVASDRNNEIAIYSSAWIDYLRNGYNFDKKRQSMDIASSSLSAVGGLVTSLLSIIGGAGMLASGGGAPAGVAMIAGGVTSAVGAGVGAGTSIASSVISQNQREESYKRQAMNVASINDLSLFKAYGGGGIRLQVWEAREDYKKRLESLFYYKGYNVSQTQAPALHARKWFDYIEASPSWSPDALANCQQRFLTLLSQKLSEGVTIFHKVGDAWDLAQEKGNYEIDK